MIDMRPRGVTVPGSDERLIALLADGAPEGIEMLYDRYGRLAYTLAVRVVGDPGVAEDVVQEAFLSMWKRAASYRTDRGSLRTWLCTVVRNRAVDKLRGRSGQNRSELPLQPTSMVSSISETWDRVAEELERDEVHAALLQLSADQRQILELAYFGGLSQSEISTRLDIPLGTVKGRTRLALRKLHSLLAGDGVSEGRRDDV